MLSMWSWNLKLVESRIPAFLFLTFFFCSKLSILELAFVIGRPKWKIQHLWHWAFISLGLTKATEHWCRFETTCCFPFGNELVVLLLQLNIYRGHHLLHLFLKNLVSCALIIALFSEFSLYFSKTFMGSSHGYWKRLLSPVLSRCVGFVLRSHSDATLLCSISRLASVRKSFSLLASRFCNSLPAHICWERCLKSFPYN